jgi:hypothetical protein
VTSRDWERPSGTAVAIVDAGNQALTRSMTSAGWSVTSEVTETWGGAPTFLVLSWSPSGR